MRLICPYVKEKVAYQHLTPEVVHVWRWSRRLAPKFRNMYNPLLLNTMDDTALKAEHVHQRHFHAKHRGSSPCKRVRGLRGLGEGGLW